MLLNTKYGIACDMCLTSYKNKFIYYSFDFNEIEVNSHLSYTHNNGVQFDSDIF